GIDTFSLLIEVQVVSGDISSKGKSMHRTDALAMLLNKGVVYQGCRISVILDLVIVNYGTPVDIDLGHRVRKHGLVCKTLMAFDDLHLRIFFHYNEVPGLHHQGSIISGGEVDDLNRLVSRHVL